MANFKILVRSNSKSFMSLHDHRYAKDRKDL